jgi:predicted RNase H-like HicB family nuclease
MRIISSRSAHDYRITGGALKRRRHLRARIGVQTSETGYSVIEAPVCWANFGDLRATRIGSRRRDGEQFDGSAAGNAWYDRSRGVMRLTAVYMKVSEGYVAFVEELPGANTQGETLEEARTNLEEAVTMVLDANREMSEQLLAGANVIRENLILPAA